MLWIVVIIAVAAVSLLAFRPKKKLTVRENSRNARLRADLLPPEERAALASEIRATALNGYNTINLTAKGAWKG